MISFFGLKGEANREKLANTFNTPTSWGDYCAEVSLTNCTSEDNVAKRSPSDESEAASYFGKDLYTGYFRQLEKNNCTIHPETCNGHFVNGLCTWTTYGESQMHWNDIALQSDGPLEPNSGYTWFHMLEIWDAANATQSDVMMWWWSPDVYKEAFAGTPAEFQRVTFPSPSNECIRYRHTNLDEPHRCSIDPEIRIGEGIGSCDYQPFSVVKLLSKGLQTMVESEEDELLRSPSFQLLKAIQIPTSTMNALFADWKEIDDGEYGPREAVCRLVYDNLDSLERHIPYGFPRTVIETENFGVTRTVALITCSIALVCVMTTAVLTMKWRTSMILKLAHVDILLWVISGATLVVIGAFATAIKISNATCILSKWFTVLGYVIELIPIIIKVGTINKLVREAQRLRPMDINPKHLDSILICTILLATVYLTLCTILDPMKMMQVPIINPANDFEVIIGVKCSSSSHIFNLTDYMIQGLILVIATVLTFQSRDVFAEFNEGQGLTLMVYSHFVFLVLRIIVNRLAATDTISSSTFQNVSSILQSLDIIFAISFYFGQKFMTIRSGLRTVGTPNQSSRTLRNGRATCGGPELNNIERIEEGDPSFESLQRQKKAAKLIGSLYLPVDSYGDISISAVSELSR